MRVTALAGGTGAAKLLRGLAACVAPADLTVVVNTGDDAEVWGLHVSPDLDTVTYALAGRLDLGRGWGLAGETFRCRDAMAALGAPTWFNLGDADLATHLFRTERLRAGEPLSVVTAALTRRLGVAVTVLPMSDDPVRTRVRVAGAGGAEGDWLGFQEYFVREGARPPVLDVAYEGASRARPGPGVVEAVLGADLVVVCPSNPVTSIGPILAVPRVVEALCSTRAPIVAVSPIVGDAPVSGPAGALMRARGLPVSVGGVAEAYRPWLDCLVIDRADAARRRDVERRGIRAVLADIVMTDAAGEAALARVVLTEAPAAVLGRTPAGARPR
jgi:LPPG:FO 2-phospho-L-lactate transferase